MTPRRARRACRARDLRSRRARSLRSRRPGSGRRRTAAHRAGTATQPVRVGAQPSRRDRHRLRPGHPPTTASSRSTGSTRTAKPTRTSSWPRRPRAATSSPSSRTSPCRPPTRRPSPTRSPRRASGAVDRSHFSDAWATDEGTDVRIAVIDSGVQGDHEDLAGQVVAGQGLRHPRCHRRPDRLLRSRHARRRHRRRAINGVGGVGGAPAAKIVSARVLNCSGAGSIYNVEQGSCWGVNARRRRRRRCAGGQPQPRRASSTTRASTR